MKITKANMFDGTEATMDIDITQEQYDKWQSGELIQNVMPEVSLDEREFLLSGITPEQWKEMFG